MTREGWIIVPNWERFQHYGDRDPTWIKVYTELNSRDDWRALTYSERGLVVSIWVEFARAKGLLRADDLSGRLGQRHDPRALRSLNEAGFIETVASKPLALARSREKEKEEEEESARVPAREGKRSNSKGRKRAERWIANGAAAEVPPERLGDVIADEFGLTDPETVAQLAAQAAERKP